MTIEELIKDMDFSSNQRNEMFIAYDENRAGFERIAKRAAGANNPPAALIAMVRKKHHLKDEPADNSAKPAHDTLEDIVAIGVRSYNARVGKYPDQRGSAGVYYAAWVAGTWNGRYSTDQIAGALMKRLALEDAPDPTPTPCPPELLARMQRQAGRIGVMPKDEPSPTLAERLLAMVEKAA